MAFDVLRGFQVGQQMAGPNAIGIAIKGLLDRVGALQQTQLENRFKFQMIGKEAEATARAKYAYDPEAQLKTKLFSSIAPNSVEGNQLARSVLGLPKTPEQLAAEAEAEEVGKSRGPQEAERMHLLKLQQAAEAAKIAQTQQTRNFWGVPPPLSQSDIDLAQERYGGILRTKIRAIRPDGRPVLIDRDKVALAIQRGYRIEEQ